MCEVARKKCHKLVIYFLEFFALARLLVFGFRGPAKKFKVIAVVKAAEQRKVGGPVKTWPTIYGPLDYKQRVLRLHASNHQNQNQNRAHNHIAAYTVCISRG